MANPLTPAQMMATLARWGVRTNYIPGWTTRGRNFVGHGAWGPVYGFLVHHTADDAPDDADLRVVRDGRSDLPGPLAQFGGRDDGSIDVIAIGRANHAGTGDPGVYAALQRQSYGDYPPKTHYHEGMSGGIDGNARMYGIETYYSGSHAPTQVQYRAAVLLAAALCDACGWTSKAVLGHKEWSDWKPDPGHVDMATMRADVAYLLHIGPAAAAAWAYGTTQEDDDMAFTDDKASQLDRIENLLLTGRQHAGLGDPQWPYPFTIGQATLSAAQNHTLDPAAIAAAIPDDLAQAVVDKLAERLAPKA